MQAKFMEDNKNQMPAGKYLVVDPCYVFGDDEKFWWQFCAFSPKEGTRRTFYVQMGEHIWFTWVTAYGDGCYPVSKRGEEVGQAPVDSGCLSIIPLALVEQTDFLQKYAEGDAGTVIEIACDFYPYEDEGDVTVGTYKVQTTDDENEDPYITHEEEDTYAY
jgi:hypothetical protein